MIRPNIVRVFQPRRTFLGTIYWIFYYLLHSKFVLNAPTMSLFKESKFECRVSSVLNKDTRNYGKQHMFDNTDETCWHSDAGIQQWILINFENTCTISAFEIEFQGGFAGKDCYIEITDKDNCTLTVERFFPEDTNAVQHFHLKNTVIAKSLKLIFNGSTDFFGRIIVYRLSIC